MAFKVSKSEVQLLIADQEDVIPGALDKYISETSPKRVVEAHSSARVSEFVKAGSQWELISNRVYESGTVVPEVQVYSDSSESSYVTLGSTESKRAYFRRANQFFDLEASVISSESEDTSEEPDGETVATFDSTWSLITKESGGWSLESFISEHEFCVNPSRLLREELGGFGGENHSSRKRQRKAYLIVCS